MPRIVDLDYAGTPRAVGAWLHDGLIVDPGPSTGLEHLLAALGDEEPRAVLLTHIHLDHAGAAGHLAARFPDLKVYVHEIGAPHIVEPERLVASSRRVFGERFALMGEVLPMPSERVVAIKEGEVAEGFEVIHTPGHAGNHVCYLDTGTGDAYVGDVAGVSIEPGPGTVMPTPPPEVDLDTWLDSIDRLAERSPSTLRLTHFGAAGDPGSHLDHCRELIHRYAELARRGDQAAFEAALDQEAADGEEATTLGAVVSPGDAWAGLERWAEKYPDAAA